MSDLTKGDLVMMGIVAARFLGAGTIHPINRVIFVPTGTLNLETYYENPRGKQTRTLIELHAYSNGKDVYRLGYSKEAGVLVCQDVKHTVNEHS